ncbi:uncharacterized protein LOC130418013 isoform X2 [Triplophysa dalaica]|uniref:uncharacterized protein LOC130418013 isoform X2 n=1 Tax=Triplophysa dalaica TaxID=1582913 RepID=UPI0024DFEF8C|nr:uncharacterized protein LOC130418013 isoform X2 [Triplophysa dalaica]
MNLSRETKSLTRGESPKPSCVSMKSDRSMDIPLNFSSGDCDDTDVSNTTNGSFKGKHMDSVFQEVEHKLVSLMKKELKIFKSLLSPDYPSCSEREEEDDEDQIRVREMFLKITLNVLKKMKQTDLANKLQTRRTFRFTEAALALSTISTPSIHLLGLPLQVLSLACVRPPSPNAGH